jgi:hypothetical protein
MTVTTLLSTLIGCKNMNNLKHKIVERRRTNHAAMCMYTLHITHVIGLLAHATCDRIASFLSIALYVGISNSKLPSFVGCSFFSAVASAFGRDDNVAVVVLTANCSRARVFVGKHSPLSYALLPSF